MRVAFLTQWFNAEDAEPQAQGLISGVGQALADRGASVTVFSGEPIESRSQLPLSRRLATTRGTVNGLPVRRYPFFDSHDESAARRLATYASFAAMSSQGIGELAASDVVLAYCSPATAAAAALTARKVYGVPYVMMVQDLWPDSIFATGFLNGGWSHRTAEVAMNRYMATCYRNASGVTALSPGMRDLLISRGTEPATTRVVFNWTNEHLLSEPVGIPHRRPGEPLHVAYAGNIGPAQNLENVLDALTLIDRGAVRLSIFGSGTRTEAILQRAHDLGLSNNVVYRGWVTREELVQALGTSHMSLVSLADKPAFRITIPSKTQFLLAAGVPVLAVAPGEVGSLVESAGAGLAAPPGDPAALARALTKAAAMSDQDLHAMATRAAGFYRSQMSEAINGDRLFEVLGHAALDRRPGRKRWVAPRPTWRRRGPA